MSSETMAKQPTRFTKHSIFIFAEESWYTLNSFPHQFTIGFSLACAIHYLPGVGAGGHAAARYLYLIVGDILSHELPAGIIIEYKP